MSNPFQSPDSVIEVSGKTVTIKEVRMKDLQLVSTVCAPFFDAFDSAGELAKEREALGKTSETLLYRLLSDHAAHLLKMAEALTDAPSDWLSDLPPDQFFDLAARIIEVNASFFIQRLLPSLQKMAKGVGVIGRITMPVSI